MTAADKILALVPESYIKKIPFFVRKHAISRTVEKIAKEHPDLYAKARQDGPLDRASETALRAIVIGIFEEKMKKHGFTKG